MTFPPPGQQYGPPPTAGGGAPGYPPGYPQQPYGTGYSPYPGPPGPQRPGGMGRQVAVGVLGGIASFALLVLVAAVVLGSRDAGPVRVPDTAASPQASPSPGDESSNATDADLAGIRSAMQRFVDAVNTHNVPQIQAAVCTAVRPQVIKPVDITGDVVFEGLGKVTVTGDSAESQVSTHLEVGAQRSTSKQEDESFTRESGTWYVCPGAQPDIGT